MPKYLITTESGKYLVETDGPAAGVDAQTGDMAIPDARVNLHSLGNRILPGNGVATPAAPVAGGMSLGAPVSLPDSVNPAIGAGRAVEGTEQIANAKNFDDVAGGASKVIRGGMQTVAPLALPVGLIAAPVPTVAGLAVGTGAGKLAHAGLKAAGASDNVADLGEDLTGLAAGGAAAHGAGVAGQAISDVGLPFMIRDENAGIVPRVVDAVKGAPGAAAGAAFGGTLDPAEAAAVEYGRENGVHMPTSIQTGSKVAAGAQKLLEHVPFGPSRIAEESANASRSTLADAGANELSGLNPNGGPVAKPLDAGEGIAQAALAKEKAHSSAADNAYDLFRSIESQPQFAARVQTGTQRVLDPANVDEAGNPVYTDKPVLQDIQAPVDRRAAKLALKPVLDRVLRLTPLAQEQSSVGIKALKNIVDGSDYESASITDEDLGAIKGIVRDSTSAQSRGLAQFAVQQLSKAVDAAAQRMGPDAVEALKQGRQETTAKYAAQDYQRALGFKNVGTGTAADLASPVGLVDKLSADGDRNIKLLRQVQQNAPEQIPSLAQAVAQGLVDKVTANAGMDTAQSALRAYSNLGSETKQILFGDKAQNFQNFFTLAKRLADNPNRSGTGTTVAVMKLGGLLLTSPITGAASLLGSRVLARMLFNPETSALMQAAMKLPANAKGAGLLAGQLSDAAARMGGAEAAAGASGQSRQSISTPSQSSESAPVAAAAPARSADTFVTVPGEPANVYRAQYKVVPRSSLVTSHSGKTFNANPDYAPLANDRNYATATNQGPVVGWSSRAEFDPRQLINDNADATTGPLITNSKGQVLGGNNRGMILERVYADKNHPGADAYRAKLDADAAHYGIDPASYKDISNPVLVREIPDSEFAGRTQQQAISDFNKTGTKALTPAERAIADSRRVSPETLDRVAGLLESHGPDATISDVLQGQQGKDVLNKLIDDGVITTQERGALEDKNGLTPDGRDRIAALMAGRFFRDPKVLDSLAPSLRNKIIRLAAPFAQVETRGDWNLTPHMQDAVDILHQAQALGTRNVDDFIAQDGLFGTQKYSPEAQALAHAIAKLNPTELVAAARQYAGDSNFSGGGASLFGGDPDPGTSFADAFGRTAVDKAIEARAAKKNALAGTPAAGKPKNSLSK